MCLKQKSFQNIINQQANPWKNKKDALTTQKESDEWALTPRPIAVQLGLGLIWLETADSSLASTSWSADLGRCVETNWKDSGHAADTQSSGNAPHSPHETIC